MEHEVCAYHFILLDQGYFPGIFCVSHGALQFMAYKERNSDANTTGIYDSHSLRILRFQKMPKESDTSRCGTKESLLTKKAIGTQGK